MALVFLYDGVTQYLGQLTAGITAKQVHLPQTITRGDIALREIEIVIVVRLDVGNAALVAADRNPVLQTCDLDRT